MRSLKICLILGLAALACLSVQGPVGALAEEAAAAPAAWPVSRDGLLFAYETNFFKNPTFALDEEGKPILMYGLMAKDHAHYDRNFAMVLPGGSLWGERIGPYLAAQCQKSNALTLEAFVTPLGLDQTEPGVLMMFGSDGGVVNFSLTQVKNKLLLALRTNITEEAAQPVEICALPDGKPLHLAVTYSAGNLVCYVNGKEFSHNKGIVGGFSNWDVTHLAVIFGDDWVLKHNWSGTLEGIAFYSRALSADEAAAEYKAYAAKVATRKPPTVLRIKGTLLAKSPPGGIEDLGPYTRATVLYEYAVKEVAGGKYKEKTMRVIHWGIMDRKFCPIVERAIGKDYNLVVEPFSENPQMEGEMLRNDLPVTDMPWYCDVQPWPEW